MGRQAWTQGVETSGKQEPVARAGGGLGGGGGLCTQQSWSARGPAQRGCICNNKDPGDQHCSISAGEARNIPRGCSAPAVRAIGADLPRRGLCARLSRGPGRPSPLLGVSQNLPGPVATTARLGVFGNLALGHFLEFLEVRLQGPMASGAEECQRWPRRRRRSEPGEWRGCPATFRPSLPGPCPARRRRKRLGKQSAAVRARG